MTARFSRRESACCKGKVVFAKKGCRKQAVYDYPLTRVVPSVFPGYLCRA